MQVKLCDPYLNAMSVSHKKALYKSTYLYLLYLYLLFCMFVCPLFFPNVVGGLFFSQCSLELGKRASRIVSDTLVLRRDALQARPVYAAAILFCRINSCPMSHELISRFDSRTLHTLTGAPNARDIKHRDCRPISRFNSEIMQDRATVTMKGE